MIDKNIQFTTNPMDTVFGVLKVTEQLLRLFGFHFINFYL
ncbi:hypothetical protein SAMN05880574_11863 [Chryseobacterium sp. RU37D]|nr:hypothetical protein SAMN05880574_11863 [Chryseobacterium sp. RU37D]